MHKARDRTVVVIPWKHLAIAVVLVLFAILLFPLLNEILGPRVAITAGRTEYKPGDAVKLEGWAREAWLSPSSHRQVALEVRAAGIVVWVDQVMTDEAGHFHSAFRLREDSPAGLYEAYASLKAVRGMTTFTVSG